MKDSFTKILTMIKKTISRINFKSKKTLLFIGLFVFALTTGAILISYSYYTSAGTKNLVISGYAFLSDADVSLKIYHEDKDANGNGLGTYSRAYYIPQVNYNYNSSLTYCTAGVTIDSFENGEFSISSTQKGFCKVYFDAVDGIVPDSTFRLYVEQNMDKGDYKQAGQLPDNDYVYVVNTTKTSCTDPNATVEVVARKIEVTTSMDLDCDIYVDIEALTGGGVYNLSELVIAKADGSDRTSITNGSVYRVIDQEAKIPDTSATYAKLTQSQYGTTSEYKGTSYTSTSGTTTTGMFDYNASDNTWKNDTTNMATSSYYHLKIPVTEEGVYQICYKVTSAASTNYLYAYVTNSSFSTSGTSKLSKALSSTSSTFTCTDLGPLTTSQGIRIVNRTYTSKAAVTFYLQKAPLKSVSAGIRYEGANPDNYVKYNGEEWRIIGTFDGADIGLESGKKYTKIIRSNVFNTTYPWDWEDADSDGTADSGEYVSDWTESTLKIMLNSDYLNQSGDFVSTATDKGLGADARGMIAQYNGNYSKWYLGAIDITTEQFGSSDGYYIQERGTIGYSNTTDLAKLSTNAAIGIIYPSDYGYAMYGGVNETTCINTTTILFSGGYDSCEQYDWLWLSGKNQWTISPYTNSSFSAHNIRSYGNLTDGTAYGALGIRPVLYLEADVQVVGGNGSQGSPYKLN